MKKPTHTVTIERHRINQFYIVVYRNGESIYKINCTDLSHEQRIDYQSNIMRLIWKLT